MRRSQASESISQEGRHRSTFHRLFCSIRRKSQGLHEIYG